MFRPAASHVKVTVGVASPPAYEIVLEVSITEIAVGGGDAAFPQAGSQLGVRFIGIDNIIGRSHGSLVALGEEEIQEWGIDPSGGGGICGRGDGDPCIWIGVRVGRLTGGRTESSEGDLTAKGIVSIGLGDRCRGPTGR